MFWSIIGRSKLDRGVDIKNMKHVYDALEAANIGQADTNGAGAGVTDLDKLFAAHGFCVDANSNQKCDSGETIGRNAFR